MDGNGRWANLRGLSRTRGHREGAERVDEIVTECTRLGVRYLTLYAFSTENWGRPAHEVRILMGLLVRHLRTMDAKLKRNRVSLVAQGSLDRLPAAARAELARVTRETALETPAMVLNLCLSYGGREEIVHAAKALAERVRRGDLEPAGIDETVFRDALYHPEIPDPDLLVRTGGEMRVSNFLLWQVAYSEIAVTDVLWPDFTPAVLRGVVSDYTSRERRFGLTSAQIGRKFFSRSKRNATQPGGTP